MGLETALPKTRLERSFVAAAAVAGDERTLSWTFMAILCETSTPLLSRMVALKSSISVELKAIDSLNVEFLEEEVPVKLTDSRSICMCGG